MYSWICFLVLGFVPYVISNGESLLVPCKVKDIECLSQSTEKFLENTCRGIPEHDFKAIDPLVIPGPLTHIVDKDMQLVFRFKNLNVTGLRNQKISDFQMDLDTKSVLLKTQADLNIISDIEIELEGSKTFSGVYLASASVLGTARYKYNLRTDDKGVEYFVVGPETLTCETIQEPVVSLNQELQDALNKDPVAASKKPSYIANSTNYRKSVICKITEEAYHDVVHNIRAAAKILPKTAFFIDV